nr:LysR family transcriptional regulator [Pseudomonas sp.]
MRLQDLRLFLHVAEQGNLHRTAEALGVTQSALSKTLVRLERDVGMQLFERTPRGVTATEAGQTLVRHARKVLLAVSDLEDELGEQRVARSGTVRLGSLPYLLPSLISPLLAGFFSSRPLATFSIETHLSAHLVALLQAGQVDLVLAAAPQTLPRDLEYVPLGVLTMQIVARAGHPRLHTFKSMADLGQERWAMPSASLYLRHWLEERFTTVGLPPPRLAVESSASPVAFAELLRCSDLLGIMPPRVLQQPVGQGLVAITGEGMSWHHELGVFWRKGGYLSPICRDFRDAVVQWCKQNGI